MASYRTFVSLLASTLFVSCALGTDDSPASVKVGACSLNARVIEMPGSESRCECLSGWVGDGYVCEDNVECAVNNGGCGADGICVEGLGRPRTCECGLGKVLNASGGCEPVSACVALGCGSGAFCVEEPGRPARCECRDGYRDTGTRCVDIDECEADTVECGAGGSCYNLPGSFLCECGPGYGPGADGTCANIDECAAGPACPAGSVCVDRPGRYECVCADGYTLEGEACVDVDECAAGEATCDVNADCANLPGTYACTCRGGYRGDGRQCISAATCDDGFVCHAEASCVETPGGGHECECAPGRVSDGTACVDLDECAADPSICPIAQQCVNAEGGYDCVCPAGFEVSGDACADVDECAAPGVCDNAEQCENREGGFECICATGFRLGPQGDCVDINECQEGADTCAVQARCDNRPGGYECTCNGPEFFGNGQICTAVGYIKPPGTLLHRTGHVVELANTASGPQLIVGGRRIAGLWAYTRNGAADWTSRGQFFTVAGNRFDALKNLRVEAKGDFMIIGDPGGTGRDGTGQAGAYSGLVWDSNRNVWVTRHRFVGSNNSPLGDGIGRSVATDGQRFMVGSANSSELGVATFFDSNGSDSRTVAFRGGGKLGVAATGFSAIGDPDRRELILYSGTTAIQRITRSGINGFGGRLQMWSGLNEETLLAVGAPRADRTVLYRPGLDGNWRQIAELTGPEEFGESIAFAARFEGQSLAELIMVVGAPRADRSPGLVDAGRADVFRVDLENDVLVRIATLIAPDADADDQFGLKVAALGTPEGFEIAVGAPHEDSDDPNDPNDNSARGRGAVYTFFLPKQAP